MAKVYQKRAGAAVKKQRREAQKRANTQAFLKKHKTHLLLAAAALAVLVIAGILISNHLAGIGTIPVKGGALEGANDHWIVANLSPSGKARYYKLGEAATPEGYQPMDAQVIGEASLEQGPGFEPIDAASPLTSIYYLPISNSNAQYMASLFSTLFSAPVETHTFGQHTLYTVPTVLQNTAGSTKTDADGYPLPSGYSGVLYAFVDCRKDSCIMVQVLGDEVPVQEDVTSREDLLAALEQGALCLTLEAE